VNYPEVPEGLFRVNVDLDGTLANSVWPAPYVGPLIPDGFKLVQHYYLQGYEVVIFTSRPESHRPRIMEWLRQVGLYEYVYDIICGKPLGLTIDDRSANPLQWRKDG